MQSSEIEETLYRFSTSSIKAEYIAKFEEILMGNQLNLFVIYILLLGSLFFAGCATNPVTGKQDFVLMSEEQEINLGKQAHQEVMKQYRPYNNPALQSYVEGLVDELGKKSHRSNLVYHVTVLDSPQINAFALPGGYLYITRGIMAYMNSEAELAGVLGHELGHVTARHGVRQQSAGTIAGILGAGVGILTGSNQAAQVANVGSTALIRGYGRNHELEADRLGAEYLANVGYDPQEMLKVV
ncbi:MAG: M48 family metalloprotease, partial [Gammaproteobacteria bacterium]